MTAFRFKPLTLSPIEGEPFHVNIYSYLLVGKVRLRGNQWYLSVEIDGLYQWKEKPGAKEIAVASPEAALARCEKIRLELLNDEIEKVSLMPNMPAEGWASAQITIVKHPTSPELWTYYAECYADPEEAIAVQHTNDFDAIDRGVAIARSIVLAEHILVTRTAKKVRILLEGNEYAHYSYADLVFVNKDGHTFHAPLDTELVREGNFQRGDLCGYWRTDRPAWDIIAPDVVGRPIGDSYPIVRANPRKLFVLRHDEG